MNRSVDSIITDVRTCINENADNEADMMMVTVDDSELDHLIRSKIAEAIDFVHGNADVSLLAGDTISYSTDSDAVVKSDGSVDVELSEESGNVLRVVGAKLGTWTAMVRDVVSGLDTHRCAMITAAHAGANHQRPAAIRRYDSGKYILSLYRSGSESKDSVTVAYLRHADMPEGDASGTVAVDKNLYTAIVNYCAALVYTTLGQTDRVKEMAELATVEMGINSGEQNQ